MDVRDHVFWQLAGPGREHLLGLPPTLQQAVLRQFERHSGRRVAEDLARLLAAPWWAALPLGDRVRATRVVAHVSARASGTARAEHALLCPRTILDGTLGSILPPRGCFELCFHDLPLEDGVAVAGLRLPPRTVVLNRRAIAVSDERLGEGGALEVRVGLATLVHEVNHLHNLTPVGPTYEAFQDEYRAWLVDFVAHVGLMPRRVEALARCQVLLGSPAYAALGQALTGGTEDGARILEFMRSFGPVTRPPEVHTLQAEDPLGEAPLPRPAGNLRNAPPAAASDPEPA